MKIHRYLKATLLAVAGAALAGLATTGRAQTITDSYTNNFDDGTSVASWNYWYDILPGSHMAWDGTVDHTPGTPGSGSLLYQITWPGRPSITSGGQEQVYGTFGNTGQYDTSQSIDGTKYDSISFDLLADTNSPLNVAGNICTLSVGLFSSYSIHSTKNIVIPATNGWMHIVAPIDKTDAPISQGVGFNINCYGGDNRNLVTNTTTTQFWIDNLQVNLSFVKSPPPILASPINPAPGLHLGTSADTTDQYQRTSIEALNSSGTGWVGYSGPITYAVTITNAPQVAGYQTHIFLTTGNPGAGESSPDYNETNLIWLDIESDVNGGATASFRYKINEYSSNSNLFGAEYIGIASAGTLANVHSASIKGTWSMTFNQDTNVTINTPDGTVGTFTIRPEVAAAFADPSPVDGNPNPIHIYVGAQPNGTNKVGLEVILSGFAYTNDAAGTTFSDNFTGDTLDTATWRPVAADVNAVQQIPPTGGEWISWTRPDSGFSLQASGVLTDVNSWTTLTGPVSGILTTYPFHGATWVFVPAAQLANPTGPNYFRLIQDH